MSGELRQPCSAFPSHSFEVQWGMGGRWNIKDFDTLPEAEQEWKRLHDAYKGNVRVFLMENRKGNLKIIKSGGKGSG